MELHAIVGDRVRLTLAAPERDFSYLPLAVAEPFGLGHAYRVPLSQFADDADADLVVDATGQRMAFTTLVFGRLLFVFTVRGDGPFWDAGRYPRLFGAVALSAAVAFAPGRAGDRGCVSARLT